MRYSLSFVTSLPDPGAFHQMMVQFFSIMAPKLAAAGGPDLSVEDLAAKALDRADQLCPPDGRLLLATDEDGALCGCGTIRRIRPDAAELKKMFVRPDMQGRGLGRHLFERRVNEARNMGCRTLYADTIRGNRPMLTMYETFGFSYIDRYPENANPEAYAPFLVFLEYTFPD